MAATAVQATSTIEGGVQCRRLEKQTRGYQVLHGPGSPNGRAKEKHEVLSDGPGPAKYDPGLPLVRGDATEHRLGLRMAQLRPATSGPENVKCP